MNIEKVLKTVATIGSVYMLAEACYQCGKGHMLRVMKKHNVTADVMLNALTAYPEDKPLTKRINNKIIVSVATLTDE